MKSIDFPGAFLKIGEGQDEYHTIHAMPIDGEQGEVIAIYRLTVEEVKNIVESKTIFYSRWTFKEKFQPMRISTEPIKFNVKLKYPDGPDREVLAEIRPDGVHIPGYRKTETGQYIQMTEEEIEEEQKASQPKEWFVKCSLCGCDANKNTYKFCMNCGTGMIDLNG